MTDDELLEPRPGSPNEELRVRILDRTARRLRRQQLAHRAMRVGVCAACFLAGAATMLLRPAPEPRTVIQIVREEVPAAPRPEENVPPSNPPSPAELELQAEKTLVRAESARRFREAGDLYLRDYADHRSALRCYRNFLDEADPADLVIRPDDTWLLTSLKRARELETNP